MNTARAEQIIVILQKNEIAKANGKTTAQACKKAQIAEQIHYSRAKSTTVCRSIRPVT